ncbi:probable very-long-chain enoyl-CoA reductase art-1 [Porites lutea]|uniref:probable very-long-chain enoyl-CoA reductase art-1 n=1 Tax=Porites lutea TaxID=51062 RepID=UPI003CC54214
MPLFNIFKRLWCPCRLFCQSSILYTTKHCQTLHLQLFEHFFFTFNSNIFLVIYLVFGDAQVYTGLALFLFNKYGNFVIHCALRDLRPPGTKERKIPYPTSNPLTQLFRFVSCPNYTYETGSWIAFSVMTQTLTAVLFTLFGFYQMAVWAIGKHRNYRKEFEDYPKGRKAIVPFLL